MHCENEAKDGQPGASEGNWDTLPARDDERQVRLDIDRSLVNFPHGKFVHQAALQRTTDYLPM